ncbi:Transcriptional regulator, XRE family (fragment) [Paraburkholderia ribeironis]|uniref:Transcriptional regulator, XRE family n=1 Tax=Paraburkholderia ribeironis TaxID=1247936 RepID=A0A1N7S8X3_9BURK
MQILPEVRYTYVCAACLYRGTVLRPDASHARELAICARCDGQVWLYGADPADEGKALNSPGALSSWQT